MSAPQTVVPIREHLDDVSDEWSLVGAYLAHPDRITTLLGPDVDPALFTDHAAREMFLAACALRSRGAESKIMTLTDELRRTGNLHAVGGPAAVLRLASEFDHSPAMAQAALGRMRHKAALGLLARGGELLAAAGSDWTGDPLERAADLDKLAARIRALHETAGGTARPKVEFLSPSQVRAFVAPDGWNLVGEHHVQRNSPFVVGGAPGVGKSRAATALAVAGATGAEWFGLPVRQKFRTMILQAENGPVRLRDEYAGLDDPIFDAYIRVCTPPPQGFAFSDREFADQLRAAIEEFRPDVFIVDPWNRATSDDKSKDYLETFNVLQNLLPTGEAACALGIVAHTRKPAAGERTNGRALLNILAGGYALGSVPRSAFVIQHASDDAEETRVVFNCVKNNDGHLGPRSAWVRCNGLFQPVDDFDWQEFDAPGEKRRVVTESDLESVFSDGENGWHTLPRGEAVNLLMERTGLGKTACYKALEFTGIFKNRLKEKQGGVTLK